MSEQVVHDFATNAWATVGIAKYFLASYFFTFFIFKNFDRGTIPHYNLDIILDDCGIDIYLNLEDDFSIGGRKTATHFPWMGSLGAFDQTTRQWRHRCGTTLIKKSFALTAAHSIARANPKRYFETCFVLNYIIFLSNSCLWHIFSM